MKNWDAVSISETDFDLFERFGQAVKIPNGIVAPNSGVLLTDRTGRMKPAVYDVKLKAARPLTKDNPIRGMKPPNRDLHLLYDHLQNDDVQIVIVDGLFGTGKTSTVIAHAVSRMINDGGFTVYLTKPHVPHGRTYGHLPGDMHDKTDWEFESYYQYFERYDQTPVETRKALGQIKIAPMEYIRGRDFQNAWVIVDEAQNLSVHEAITIASRVADGSKLILLGDTSPWQFDVKHKDLKNCGLHVLKELLIGHELVGYVELRSEEHILRGKIAKTLIKALNSEKGKELLQGVT